MNVKFFHSAAAFDADGKPLPPVELVSISGDFMGRDEVVRAATEDDRRRFHPAYAEFKAEQAPKGAPAVALLAPVQTFAPSPVVTPALTATAPGLPPSAPGEGAKAEEIE